MRQERVHPLVCSLPHFSTEKWQKLVDQNTLKGKRDKKSAQRQTSGCSNLLRGKTSFRFGEAEIRQGAERERESAGLKNGCCAAVFIIPRLCSPYLLLWRKLKCQSVGCPQTVAFCLLLSLLMFVPAGAALPFIKGKELRGRHVLT